MLIANTNQIFSNFGKVDIYSNSQKTIQNQYHNSDKILIASTKVFSKAQGNTDNIALTKHIWANAALISAKVRLFFRIFKEREKKNSHILPTTNEHILGLFKYSFMNLPMLFPYQCDKHKKKKNSHRSRSGTRSERTFLRFKKRIIISKKWEFKPPLKKGIAV